MKSYTLVRSLLVLSFVCVVGTVRAETTNLVTNGDFATDLSGWIDYGQKGSWDNGADGAPGGGNLKLGGAAWFGTNPTTPLVAGRTYQFSFDAALLHDDGIPADAGLYAKAGDSSSVYVLLTPTLTSTWTHYSGTFTETSANVGHAYEVTFLNSLPFSLPDHGAAYGGSLFGIDNVRLSAVPEPSTFVLFGATLFGLLAYAWRKRK